MQAHAQSLTGGDDALTRAISRLAPERRTDLATALADCALAVDASSSSNAFQSIIAPVEGIAQRACTGQQADLELVLALYRGVATAARPALDGPGRPSRGGDPPTLWHALGPLVDAVLQARRLTKMRVPCLSVRGRGIDAVTYASRPARALLPKRRRVALCARGAFGGKKMIGFPTRRALESRRLRSYDVLVVDEEEEEGVARRCGCWFGVSH